MSDKLVGVKVRVDSLKKDLDEARMKCILLEDQGFEKVMAQYLVCIPSLVLVSWTTSVVVDDRLVEDIDHEVD